MTDRRMSLQAYDVTVTNSELTSEVSGLDVRNRENYTITIDVNNCTLTSTTTNSHPFLITLLRADATIDLEDNDFVNTGSPANYFATINPTFDGPVNKGVELNLTDNDFHDLDLKFSDTACCSAVTFTINYDGNNWNDDRCPTVDGFTDTDVGGIDIVLNKISWYYDDFGEFYRSDFGDSLKWTADEDVRCDVAYVSFEIGGAYHGPETSAIVRYGDDQRTTGSTETATYNSSTEKWEASFGVSSYTDGDFFWRPDATLCDSTRIGDSEQKQFTLHSDFADSINTNPLDIGYCDDAYVEFYVGYFNDSPSSDLTVIARYGDDAASGNTATASFNASTKRWKANFDITSFTDGDFYWQPEATLCGSTVVGDSLLVVQFEDLGDSLDTSPTIVVVCDEATTKVYVGGVGPSPSDGDVIVRYDDNSGMSSPTEVDAVFDAATGRWVAEDFDVSSHANGKIYWEAEVTFCGSTETGSQNVKHFQPGRGCP